MRQSQPSPALDGVVRQNGTRRRTSGGDVRGRITQVYGGDVVAHVCRKLANVVGGTDTEFSITVFPETLWGDVGEQTHHYTKLAYNLSVHRIFLFTQKILYFSQNDQKALLTDLKSPLQGPCFQTCPYFWKPSSEKVPITKRKELLITPPHPGTTL